MARRLNGRSEKEKAMLCCQQQYQIQTRVAQASIVGCVDAYGVVSHQLLPFLPYQGSKTGKQHSSNNPFKTPVLSRVEWRNGSALLSGSVARKLAKVLGSSPSLIDLFLPFKSIISGLFPDSSFVLPPASLS